MRFRTLTLTAGALATVLVLAGCAPTDGTMPSRAAGNMPCAASPSNRDGGQWSAAATRPASSQPGLTRAP